MLVRIAETFEVGLYRYLSKLMNLVILSQASKVKIWFSVSDVHRRCVAGMEVDLLRDQC